MSSRSSASSSVTSGFPAVGSGDPPCSSVILGCCQVCRCHSCCSCRLESPATLRSVTGLRPLPTAAVRDTGRLGYSAPSIRGLSGPRHVNSTRQLTDTENTLGAAVGYCCMDEKYERGILRISAVFILAAVLLIPLGFLGLPATPGVVVAMIVLAFALFYAWQYNEEYSMYLSGLWLGPAIAAIVGIAGILI